MRWTGRQVEGLLDDLDSALGELIGAAGESEWSLGPKGKWTAGQHADHVAKMLGMTADPLDAHARRLVGGRLGRRPWRDPLQSIFVGRVTREPFPRGGSAPRKGTPEATPERELVVARIWEGASRHRILALCLRPEARDHLWIWNPFIRLPWHYTLPEILRVHATHARHHARLAREAGRS